MKSALALPLILLSLTTYSAENVTVLTSESSNYVIKDSSEHNRLNKKFSVLLESTAGNTAAGGLSIGYYLDRQSQVILVLQSQSASVTRDMLSSLFGKKDSISGQSIGAQYKHFFGNSFFVRGGAEYREIFFKRKYDGSFLSSGTNGQQSSFDGATTLANVGIGNTWQFQNLTLGFDWIRFNLPISSQVNNEAFIAKDKESMESEKKYFLKSASVASNFHIGLSF